MRFKIDWAGLIVRSKSTVFALFYFVFEGNFPSTSPRGGLYLEGRFNGGLLALPVWGAYIWRSLYMEGLIFGNLTIRELKQQRAATFLRNARQPKVSFFSLLCCPITLILHAFFV